MSKNKEKDSIKNPIDPDKVAENPGLLPYAHHVGSAVVKPIDRGKIKGLSLHAMYEQADSQLDQIREQVNLLMNQAQRIQDRVAISESIYLADINFKPLIGQTYHLYTRADKSQFISMIAPTEWRKPSVEHIATVKLLSDHTWEILT